MNRSVVFVVVAVSVVTAATIVWMEVRQEREFRRLLAEGDAALAEGRTSEAVEAFSGALAFKPTSMVAHLKRAATYYRRGELELPAALRDAMEASALDPTAPQPAELLGDITSALGQHERAAAHYERYLQLDDQAARVFYKLALANYKSGRVDAAVEPLRRAFALNEQLVEAHYLLGLVLRTLNRPDEAVRALRRAITLNAAFVPAREELADLSIARGRSRDAIEQLEAIAALEPSRPEWLVKVAMLYARSGRRDVAVVTLARAIERHPESQAASAALGRVWLEAAGEDDDSVAIRKAIDALRPIAARPDATSETLSLFGEALLQAGRVTEAERILQLAVTKRPVEPAAYQHLAEAARRRGHASVARDAAARYSVLAVGRLPP